MNWRGYGGITLATWTAELKRLNSPIYLEGEAEATYNAAAKGFELGRYNLTKFCLAVLFHESKYGTQYNNNTVANKNPLNMRPRGLGGFQKFTTYEAGFKEWYARVLDPKYAYANTATLEDFVNVYAPGWDNNNVAEYVNVVTSMMRMYEEMDAVLSTDNGTDDIPVTTKIYSNVVAGLPGGPLLTDYPIHPMLIPIRNGYQRPGRKAHTPRRSIQHGTGNQNSLAYSDATWIFNGADGAQTCMNFETDDTEVYQLVPVDEVTYQAADGSGPGNENGISSEMSENTAIWNSPTRRARNIYIAADLLGRISARLGAKVPEQHFTFNWGECCDEPCDVLCGNRHDCPQKLRRTMVNGKSAWEALYVPQWYASHADELKRMGGVITTPVPIPTVVKPHPVGHESKKDGKTFIDASNNHWYWFAKTVTPAKEVQSYEYASLTSAKGPKIEAHTPFIVYWLVATPSQKTEHGPEIWGTTRQGWRIPMDSIL